MTGAVPDRTPTRPPAPSATPVAPLEVRSGRIVDLLETRTFAHGEPIDWDRGLFFMDVPQGAVHALRAKDAPKGWDPAHFAVFPDGSAVMASSDGPHRVLRLDRTHDTATFMTFPANYRPVAFTPVEMVVRLEPGFATPSPPNPAVHEVYDWTGAVIDRFKLDGRERTWWATDDPDRWYTWDANGSVAAVRLSSRSDDWRVAPAGSTTLSVPFDIQPGRRGPVAYSWDDDEGVTVARAIVSDGDGETVREFRDVRAVCPGPAGLVLAEFREDAGLEGSRRGWPSVEVSLAGIPDAFRYTIRSASLGRLPFGPVDRWLADGSGCYLAVARSGEIGDWALFQPGEPLAVPSRAALLPLPELFPLEAGLRSWRRRAPIPSPDRLELVAMGSTEVLDTRTGTWTRANLASDRLAKLDPWSARRGEVVFALAPVETFPGSVDVGLLPAVGTGRATEMRFRAARPADCLPVTSAPGSDSGALLACVDERERLDFAPLPAPKEGGVANDAVLQAGDAWIHVRTADGTEGWSPASGLRWDGGPTLALGALTLD